jgi:hypothetical protein
VLAYAVADPRAMVVKLLNASVANGAVDRAVVGLKSTPRALIDLARFTVFQVNNRGTGA